MVVTRDISEDECFDQKVKDLVSLQSEEKPVNREKEMQYLFSLLIY